MKYEMLNKCSLVRVKFMSDVHLRKPEFRHSSCRPSTKNKKRIQRFVKKKKKLKIDVSKRTRESKFLSSHSAWKF